MDEKTIGTVVGGIVAALVVLWLVIQSGVLLWAIFLGVIVSAVTLLLRRELRTAVAAGGITTVLVSFLGVLAMMSPGWYRSLLQLL